MKRGYADTPEGQIHYYVEGEGEPLIMMHATGSSRQFARLQPLLAQHFKVYAFDTLGFGGSDPLPHPETISIHDLAQSVVHGMDSLGIQKAYVYGLHTGNKIGADMGAAFPDRIAQRCRLLSLEFDWSKTPAAILLNGRNVSELIRQPEVTEITYVAADNPWVREELVRQQRLIAPLEVRDQRVGEIDDIGRSEIEPLRAGRRHDVC